MLSRKGSKRLPGKALLPLLEKPLAQYTFEAAKESRLLEKTWIFSDDEALLALAKTQGISIPEFERPEHISQDETSTEESIRYFLSRFENQQRPDLIMLLQPTSPLRTSGDVDAAIQRMINAPSADGLISVTPPPKPLSWVYRMDKAGSLKQAGIACETPGEKLLLPNGAIYIIRPKHVLAGKNIGEGHYIGFEMPANRSVDIDTAEDFGYAEYLLKTRHNSIQQNPMVS